MKSFKREKNRRRKKLKKLNKQWKRVVKLKIWNKNKVINKKMSNLKMFIKLRNQRRKLILEDLEYLKFLQLLNKTWSHFRKLLQLFMWLCALFTFSSSLWISLVFISLTNKKKFMKYQQFQTHLPRKWDTLLIHKPIIH